MTTRPDAHADASDSAGAYATPPLEPPPDRRPVWLTVLPELVTLLVCVALFTRTFDLRGTSEGPGPAMYPRILIVLLGCAMLIRIVSQLVTARLQAVGRAAPSAAPGADDDHEVSLVRIAQMAAIAVGFVAGTVYLGWVIATFLLVPLFCWAAGKRNLLVTVPLGAGLSLGSAYVFVRLVYIALPTGVGVFDEVTVQFFLALGIY